jgi:uncharacterized protein YndB with AHSA1/START domain
MRFVKKIFFGLLVLVAVLAGVAFLLPREVAVSRAITIAAPPEAVFPYINDLKKFNAWSPWAKIDPKTVYKFEGPASGKGQKVSWSSTHEHVGTGSQQIIESIANKHVRTALDFGDHGTAKASFDLAPVKGGTRVTWGFKTDTGNNPLLRWMGLMMDGWIGEQYEKGLHNLKTLAKPARK